MTGGPSPTWRPPWVASFSSSLRCAASYWKHPATSARGEYSTRGGKSGCGGAVPQTGAQHSELLCAPPNPRRASRDDDVLLPYSRARARLARDCTRVHAGRLEHESWPPAAPAASAHRPSVRTFVSYFADRAVPGHLTRAPEPLRTFSVLEPGGPGGCASRRRATVEETARPSGCTVAQNGGFFGMETGECLGNVVSGGRRVSSAGGLQNAQFGIRRDGTLVTG